MRVRSIGNRNSLGRATSQGVAWATMPLFLLGIGSKLWLERRLGLVDASVLEDLLLFAGFGAFALVGSLLVAKLPGNPVSWIMTAIGLMVGLFSAAETYAAYVMITRGRPDALAVLGAWVNGWYWYLLLGLALIFLPLLFPDGRLPSPRWRPVAALAGIGLAGMVALGALSDPLRGQTVDYRIDNPIGIPGLPPVEQHPLFGLFAILGLIGLLGATAGMIVRFRRSQGMERQQLKWFLYAAALLPLMLPGELAPPLEGWLLGLILVALPAAIGIAVLRYRLYDIDVIIRRTLVYSALTLLLAAVYFGGVTLLQAVFSAISNQQSAISIVISTLAIAALFNPLRERVQEIVDRRFYRRKYNAEQALASFAALARQEVDLEEISERLLRVVEQTVQPEHVSLWLKPTAGGRKEHAGRLPTGEGASQ